jgi:imidazolonepropionase-like amidohydrolase
MTEPRARRLHLCASALMLLGIAGCAGPGPPVAATASLAITDVAIVDVERGSVVPRQTIVIEGNRIVGVSASADARIPEGARIVDGAGKYAVPGLWDMHTHLTTFDRPVLGLLLASGVTGVRDMGAERFAEALALRDSIAAGHLTGPRMRVASPVVENPRWLAFAKRIAEQAGTPWTLYERFGPASAEEAERWVDSVAALGADHIKVRNWPAPEIGRALVERARLRGLDVAGHANEPFPREGIATLEHGMWPPWTGTAAARDSLWRRWTRSGTAFVPTLVTWPSRLSPPDVLLARLDQESLPGIRYVAAGARMRWRDQLLGLAQESPRDWAAIHAANVRDAAEMRSAGVTLLAGTDLGAPLVVPGLSLHDELAALVNDAGLSPIEALRAATLGPARAMGLTDSLGTIEIGKLADLVLLDADPTAAIGAARRVSAVVLNGRLFDAYAIRGLLAAAEAAALRPDR